MTRLRWLLDVVRRPRAHGQPGHRDDVDVADLDQQGLDPNTAALSEGAPPGGAGGRIQPSGDSPDPRQPRGPTEGDVQNLPG